MKKNRIFKKVEKKSKKLQRKRTKIIDKHKIIEKQKQKRKS